VAVRLCVIVATLVMFAALATSAMGTVGRHEAIGARKPGAAELRRIEAAIRSWWCANLTKSTGPCSRWTLKTLTIRLSTAVPTWGYAQISDRGTGVSTDLPGQVRLLLRRGAGGWRVYHWFIGLRGLTCQGVAREDGIPYSVMQDLGLCAFVAKLP
jgi:hypothetical protein